MATAVNDQVTALFGRFTLSSAGYFGIVGIVVLIASNDGFHDAADSGAHNPRNRSPARRSLACEKSVNLPGFCRKSGWSLPESRSIHGL
jgi:hypothetical protein